MLNRRFLRSLGQVCLLAGLLVSCQKKPGEDPASNIDEFKGKTYGRVVAFAPNLAEFVDFVGASSSLAARTRFSDYPASLLSLPSIGSGLQPDLEAIALLDTRLAILLRSARNSALANSLSSLDIDVYWTRVETADDIIRTSREIAQLTGVDADDQIGRLRAGMEQLRSFDSTRTVLMVHGHDPLVCAGPGSWGDQIIRLAGYKNALDSTFGTYPSLDNEHLLSVEADIIIDTTGAYYSDPSPDGQTVRQYELLPKSEVHFVSNSGFLRPGPRCVEVAKQLQGLCDPKPPDKSVLPEKKR